MSRPLQQKAAIEMGMYPDNPTITEFFPETYGLPEYFVSEAVAEIDGPNVRIICGAKRGTHVIWLYSAVIPADVLLPQAQKIAAVAEEAIRMKPFALCRGCGGRH
jgi:hypothetical protein